MEPVKDHQGMKIIGIDNGYGNIKTANCCFPAGLTVHGADRFETRNHQVAFDQPGNGRIIFND